MNKEGVEVSFVSLSKTFLIIFLLFINSNKRTHNIKCKLNNKVILRKRHCHRTVSIGKVLLKKLVFFFTVKIALTGRLIQNQKKIHASLLLIQPPTPPPLPPFRVFQFLFSSLLRMSEGNEMSRSSEDGKAHVLYER